MGCVPIIQDIYLRKPAADALLSEVLRYGMYPEIYL